MLLLQSLFCFPFFFSATDLPLAICVFDQQKQIYLKLDTKGKLVIKTKQKTTYQDCHFVLVIRLITKSSTANTKNKGRLRQGRTKCLDSDIKLLPV